MKAVTVFAFTAAILTGCGTTPVYKVEAPITAVLDITVAEAQFGMEDILRAGNPDFIASQTENTMTIKTRCMNMKTVNTFQCSMIQLALGNASSTEPAHIQHYRFVRIDGKTHVRSEWEWCSTMPLGQTNCTPIEASASNMALRKLQEKFTTQQAAK